MTTKEIQILTIQGKIDELKYKLRSTDYQAIKYAEGVLTFAEYEEMKVKRQNWRDEINRLEEEVKGIC